MAMLISVLPPPPPMDWDRIPKESLPEVSMFPTETTSEVDPSPPFPVPPPTARLKLMFLSFFPSYVTARFRLALPPPPPMDWDRMPWLLSFCVTMSL